MDFPLLLDVQEHPGTLGVSPESLGNPYAKWIHVYEDRNEDFEDVKDRAITLIPELCWPPGRCGVGKDPARRLGMSELIGGTSEVARKIRQSGTT
jgi:hypothetical protein